jgi:hypothetical protein
LTCRPNANPRRPVPADGRYRGGHLGGNHAYCESQ